MSTKDWYRKRTLGSLLDAAADRFGEREALVFEGQRWTFREWRAQADRVAKGLMAAGIGPGHRVALWMTNRPEWLFALFGISKAGACAVPLNTRYRAGDMGYALAQSRSNMLICMERSGPVNYLDILTETVPGLNASSGAEVGRAGFENLKDIVVLGESSLARTRTYNAMLEAGSAVGDDELAARAAGVDPDGLMLIAYTSGTTANPKGVMHTHLPIRNTHERAQLLGMTMTDVHLNYMPLFHVYGYSEITMIAVMTGAKQVLMDVFDAERALDLAVQEGVNVLHGFEAHWLDLLNAQARKPRVLSMRLGTLPSGVESTIPVAQKVQEVFGPTISGFGMTECWPFVTCSNPSHPAEARINTSGYPMNDYEFRIVDPDSGRDMPAGERGEIWVRGYAVTQGYWDKPQETAEVLDDDGWLHSGDMGILRADGNLIFLGRYKDMLKVGGENVSPTEVEAFLRNMPEVLDAAVVAYPDRRLSEVPVAFIVPQAGLSLDIETVVGRCKGQIASFKIPRYLISLDSFPMTPSGKIRKVELRAMALEQLGHHGETG